MRRVWAFICSFGRVPRPTPAAPPRPKAGPGASPRQYVWCVHCRALVPRGVRHDCPPASADPVL